MKKLLSATLFCSLLLFSAFAVKAQSGDTVGKSGPPLISYLGIQDDLAIFSISYSDIAGEAFDLMVKDQDGAELYKHTFRGKHFRKQFRLPKAEKSRLSFIIRNARESDVVKTFEIKSGSRIVKL